MTITDSRLDPHSQVQASPASSPVAPTVASQRPSRGGWATPYVRRLGYTDAVSIASAVVVAQLVRFGTGPDADDHTVSTYSYAVVSLLLVLGWFGALTLFRSREPRVVGTGAEEYRRVAHASLTLFGTVAIVAFLLRLDLARGYLAVALPVGLTTLVLSRWSWRKWLLAQRLQGRSISTVLVVGSHRAAAAMADIFEHEQGAGYRVAGVCIPGFADAAGDSLTVHGHVVPVLGDENAVVEAIAATGADMVAVSNTEYLGAEGMRQLAWQLEAVDVDMVVSPGVVDVAGPRLQIRPVAGLPLLHVDKPQYRGAGKVGKTSFDLLGAAAGLLVLSPLLVAVALAVKLDSRGPVFYRAQRIGLNGEPFPMLKFRSMVTDAELQRTELLQLNQGSGPLFKLREDPRVTRVGRWIRRLSIDEVPQLVNVLRGQMSLVGPRPPLASEVMTYTGDVHRRLLVKPGLTGLWQVSGRSNLSWDASVRLDLFYVENWSLIQDLIIVWRTFGAVLKSKGAY